MTPLARRNGDAQPAPRDEHETTMSTFNENDRDKLDSVDYGARNQPANPVKLWDLTAFETTTTVANDSGPFVGSDRFLEIGTEIVLAHAYRDSGWLLLQACARASDGMNGSIQVEFTLESRDDHDTGPLADPNLAGKPRPYTVHKMWRSKPIQCSAVPRQFVFHMIVHAHGHVGQNWFQSCDGYMSWDDLARGIEDAPFQKFTRSLDTPIDPTQRKQIRVQFRALALATIPVSNAAWTEATRTITSVGAFAGWTLVPGETLEITEGNAVARGFVRIQSRLDDDRVVLATSVSTDTVPGNVSDGSIVGRIRTQHFDVTASRANLFNTRDGSGY